MEYTKEQCGICAECVPQVNGGSGITNCADAHAAETAGDKMQLSKEWLEHTISGIEAIRDEIPFGLDADEENTLAALKFTLAVLTAEAVQEPVADVVAWSSPTEERTCDIRWRRHDVEPGPLFTDPQLLPVVPNAISTRQAISKMEGCEPCDSINVAFKYGWNACRAAMLAAVPQQEAK